MPELKKYQLFIDGQWVDSDTKKTFETLNPENNKPVSYTHLTLPTTPYV